MDTIRSAEERERGREEMVVEVTLAVRERERENNEKREGHDVVYRTKRKQGQQQQRYGSIRLGVDHIWCQNDKGRTSKSTTNESLFVLHTGENSGSL